MGNMLYVAMIYLSYKDRQLRESQNTITNDYVELSDGSILDKEFDDSPKILKAIPNNTVEHLLQSRKRSSRLNIMETIHEEDENK